MYELFPFAFTVVYEKVYGQASRVISAPRSEISTLSSRIWVGASNGNRNPNRNRKRVM